MSCRNLDEHHTIESLPSMLQSVNLSRVRSLSILSHNSPNIHLGWRHKRLQQYKEEVE